MSIFKTECFGPVASVIKANDHMHALELANDSEYGLSSAVITNDLQKALDLSEGLEAGAVHINGPSVRDEPVIPFGGVKNSGTGREGGSLLDGRDDRTEVDYDPERAEQVSVLRKNVTKKGAIEPLFCSRSFALLAFELPLQRVDKLFERGP